MQREQPEHSFQKTSPEFLGKRKRRTASERDGGDDFSDDDSHSSAKSTPQRKKLKRIEPGSDDAASAYRSTTDEDSSPSKSGSSREYDERRRFLISPLVHGGVLETPQTDSRSRISLPGADSRSSGEWRGAHQRSYSSNSDEWLQRSNRYSEGSRQPFQRKDIWVVGSSYVFWAHKRALVTTGKNLGFHDTRLFWKGKRGMRWHELLGSNYIDDMEYYCGHKNPKVIIIYLSSNDVAYIKTEDLIESMTKDLQEIIRLYPNSKIVWCQLYPRLMWRDSTVDVIEGEFVREVINETVGQIMETLGGTTMTFPGITRVRKDFYRDDGVHLNDAGNDEWLKTMKAFISTLDL